jgi:hypothetical protein
MHRCIIVALMGLASLLAVAALAGCGTELETGYKPRVLGASDAERRAYYASPFTPEAQAAEKDRQEEMKSRRPDMGM